MKKKILAIMLVVLVLLLSFSGCGQSTEGENGSLEENSSEESSFRENFGDEESRKALQICIDMGKSSNEYDDSYQLTTVFNQFINEVKYATGMEDVSILFMPGEGSERESMIDRLRIEIMSGGGPDVFMLRAIDDYANYTESFITFPEKLMENGLFLPLNEYMENNTRFTDWSKQTQIVLDAGKSDEGQVIIPLTYTLPVLLYPKDEIKLEPSSGLTMQDVLNDQDTAEIGAVMYSGVSRTEDAGKGATGWLPHYNHLSSMFGKLADFESEELLFSEEDLMETLDIICSARDTAKKNKQTHLKGNVGYGLCYQLDSMDFEEKMAMIPLYSKDGGVTAQITSYAAVNRNTSYPVEAFTVIDLFTKERMQMENQIYHFCFMPGDDGIPLQEGLCSKEKPFLHVRPERYLDELYFEDLCEIKEQITNVNFRNGLDVVLEEIMADWSLEYLVSGTYDKEAVSEAYAKMERMIGE